MDILKTLNIWSRSDEEIGRLMSHFAHTPFVLDGVEFGSVEAFYAWLHIFDNPRMRAKVAPLWGTRSEYDCPKNLPAICDYHGRNIPFGSQEYYELFMRANRPKLKAHPEIARSFLATYPRPTLHELPDKDDCHEVLCGIMRQMRDELERYECATVKPNGESS